MFTMKVTHADGTFDLEAVTRITHDPSSDVLAVGAEHRPIILDLTSFVTIDVINSDGVIIETIEGKSCNDKRGKSPLETANALAPVNDESDITDEESTGTEQSDELGDEVVPIAPPIAPGIVTSTP